MFTAYCMVNILSMNMNMPRKTLKTPSEFKVLIRKAKVDHDGLGVTNVQITSAWENVLDAIHGSGIFPYMKTRRINQL